MGDANVSNFRRYYPQSCGVTTLPVTAHYMPPNKSMERTFDPGLRLATPSLSLASSSADLKR